MTSPETESPKLSTYAKGELFEQKVFDYLSGELAAGRLLLIPEFSTIHRKKKYFSRDRESFIVFDIAIEVRLPDRDTPSVIVLIECKNYDGTIPVDDVEEFSAKIDQVASHNGKGIFVSSSAFQASALNFARNKGMGVVRYLDEGNFKWELSRSLLMGALTASERRSARIRHALIEPSYEPAVHSTYAATPLGFTNSWEGIIQGTLSDPDGQGERFKNLTLPRPTSRQRVAFLSAPQIEDTTQELLQSIGYTSGRVNLGRIADQERTRSGLEVVFSATSKSALGGISFNPPQIQVFADDKHEHMARFTLAHELGHFYLDHGRYLQRELLQAQDLDSHQTTRMPSGDVERLEWQANAFAAYLLMPEQEFLKRLARLAVIHNIRNRGHGFLYLDSQPVNCQLVHYVSHDLSEHFNVSMTAVRLRLKSLGLLVDATSMNGRVPSINQIVSRRRR